MNRSLFRIILSSLVCVAAPAAALAQTADGDSIEVLDEVVASARGVRKLKGVSNTELITVAELKRAACCNLGESFSTNPSVDVNYSDAATGARQIRMLGLAGTYVQMLTENVPALRGAASQYGLSYIPGTWIQSMQVSKGAASVKNGYESVTGQINVELKKPQLDPSLAVNMYYDSENKLEANVEGNTRLSERWSAGLLSHFENKFTLHDSDGDGFADMPKVRQWSLMPRVAYMGTDYVFQAVAKVLDEKRLSGQAAHHGTLPTDPYRIDLSTSRAEFFMKHAYIFDHDNDGNVALIASAARHDTDGLYGARICDILQREAYAQLMYERKWSGLHALSAGLTLTRDDYRYRLALGNRSVGDARSQKIPGPYSVGDARSQKIPGLYNVGDARSQKIPGPYSVGDARSQSASPADRETVAGAYIQYTLNLDDRLIAMGGLRYDHSSLYGSMATPRLHLRYNPSDALSFHASAGCGHHSPRPYAEYSYLLASSRTFDIEGPLRLENAFNTGGGASLTLSPGGRQLSLSAEYYYTTFSRQLMVDLDNPHAARIFCSGRPSFSHSLQLEAEWEAFADFTVSAAWRLNDVKIDYGRGLQQKPLMSRQKALFTLSYTPDMGIWQFDATCAVNGSGVMPTPYTLPDGSPSWASTFKAYPTLNAHITRNFRHWAVYIGGENLTGYRQPHPIVGASDPWGPTFDATMIYGPLHGAMFYAGFRYTLTKYL